MRVFALLVASAVVAGCLALPSGLVQEKAWEENDNDAGAMMGGMLNAMEAMAVCKMHKAAQIPAAKSLIEQMASDMESMKDAQTNAELFPKVHDFVGCIEKAPADYKQADCIAMLPEASHLMLLMTKIGDYQDKMEKVLADTGDGSIADPSAPCQ